MRAATSVLEFHLTLRESNLPVFKLRSLHILIQGRTFIHLISRLRVPDNLGHTHRHPIETANLVQTVQLSVNRLRIFKQLKRVRFSLLPRFRYAVIICTWRESPVFNFTLYILRFLLRENNLIRLQVHELVAVVIKESSEESMIQSCSICNSDL